MDINILRKTYRSVEISIEQKRVKDALDILHKVAKETQNSLLIDEIYSIEQSYLNMLSFLTDGFKDPQKAKPYNHLLLSILTLSDSVFSELVAQYYKDYARDRDLRPLLNGNIDEIMPFLDEEPRENCEPFIMIREDNLSVLFNTIAFTSMPNQETSAAVEDIFYKTSFDDNEKLNLISAYLISLNNYFDERKIHTLLKLSDCQNLKLSSRALVVVIIACIKYNNRLENYPTIVNHLKRLSESQIKQNEIKTILFQLLNTRETEKISFKFTNEILPEMIKLSPILKKKLDLENLLTDNPLEDAMPDWEDLVNETPKLQDKIDEVYKMQQEGLDILSSTFKQLKDFAFFEHIRNWFMPFTVTQSYLQAAIYMPGGAKLDTFYSFINQTPAICDSDKYSMAFAIGMMPALQKDLMGKPNFKQTSDAINEEFRINPVNAIKNHTNLYIQDLYRFFTAHPEKQKFESIFNLNFDIFDTKLFEYIFPNDRVLKDFGQYYFKNHYFSKAAEVYELYNLRNEPQVDVLQKIGFCYQHQNQYDKALKYYLMADFFEQNRHWNLKKIALCYRNLNEPEKALKYYLLAEIEQPENLHTQAAIGQCHLELKNYEEALKYYFKVEFLDPENKKVWKPIAWCCFVVGKFEISEKYYTKQLLEEQSYLDLMSYGHLLWAMGKKHEALNQYKLSISAPDSSPKIFIENFELEVEFLRRHNIDEIEIATFLDQLRYSIEQ